MTPEMSGLKPAAKMSVPTVDSSPSGAARRLSVVLLASGAGTLAEAIIAAAGAEYEVVALVSDKQCAALDKATAAGIPAVCVPLSQGQDRAEWDCALRDAVASFTPDIVVSAGFMRILGACFLESFAGRTINTHPALLPAFPGAHAVRDALRYGVTVTGTTVHVVDGGVDTGPIIAQCAVSVDAGDDETSLHERIKIQERRLIVEVLKQDPLRAIARSLAAREQAHESTSPR